MLFVPFAIFLLNNVYVHSEVYDKVYTSKTECMNDVVRAIQNATENAPKGGSAIGGCLPLPKDVKLPVEAPKKPKAHSGPTTSL